MSKQKIAIIVISALAAVALVIGAVVVLSGRGDGGKDGGKNSGSAAGTPTTSPVVIAGKTYYPPADPDDTSAQGIPAEVNPDIQRPDGEPYYLEPDKLVPEPVPEDKNTAIRTSGAIYNRDSAEATVLCSAWPAVPYAVELTGGRLGDRVYRLDITVPDFHGDGDYKVTAGMAMTYEDGEVAPYADHEALFIASDGGRSGNIRAAFRFREGLTSVSVSFRCA